MNSSIFQSRLQTAFSSNFELLRRVPNTSVWRAIGYFKSLTDAEQRQVLKICAETAEQSVMAGMASESPSPTSRAFESPQAQLFLKVNSKPFWSDFPDRFMRQFAADVSTLSQMVDESRIASILATAPPVVARAGAIRKELHRCLAEKFGAEFVNRGGGEWYCTGEANGTLFQINIDYGGRGSGFRYGIGFQGRTNGVTLESSYGFPASANWDFPLKDCLDELAHTMCDVVEDLEKLHTEIVACQDT